MRKTIKFLNNISFNTTLWWGLIVTITSAHLILRFYKYILTVELDIYPLPFVSFGLLNMIVIFLTFLTYFLLLTKRKSSTRVSYYSVLILFPALCVLSYPLGKYTPQSVVSTIIWNKASGQEYFLKSLPDNYIKSTQIIMEKIL